LSTVININNLSKSIIKRRALNWWNKLSENEKRDKEYKIFGYGEEFEDNILTAGDIITIYNYKCNVIKR